MLGGWFYRVGRLGNFASMVYIYIYGVLSFPADRFSAKTKLKLLKWVALGGSSKAEGAQRADNRSGVFFALNFQLVCPNE